MDKILKVRWQVRYTRCNIKCPYCIVNWTKQKLEFDPDKFARCMDVLKSLPCKLVIRIGVEGEFFLSEELQKGVIELSKSENVLGVSFSTNLQEKWEKMQPFFSEVEKSKLGMGCTLHDTVIKDIDDFFFKVKNINDMGVLLYVGYVALPDRFSRIEDYKKRFDEMGVPFMLNELTGAYNSQKYPLSYTKEEREFLKGHFFADHYYNMLVELKSPKGEECLAGSGYVYVDHKADVYKCGVDKNPPWTILQKIVYKFDKSIARKMARKRAERHRIGNLLSGGMPPLSQKLRTCPYNACACGNEVQSLARVDEEYVRTRTLRVIYPKNQKEKYENRYKNLRRVS